MRKVIFWDSDGTLLYGNESFKCSLIRAFQAYGYSLDEAGARELMRHLCTWYRPQQDHASQNGEEWWADLLAGIGAFCGERGIAKQHINAICNAFRQNVVAYEYEAYADAKRMLQFFQAKGYDNYIISNNFSELGEVFVRLGLGDHIAGYFLSAEVGYEKPRKEIFAYALAKTGPPEVCYMIGDNPVADYQGALGAGMIPILVHTQLEGCTCCESLSELATIITG